MAKDKKSTTKKSSMLTTVVLGVGALAVGAGAYVYITRNEIDSIYSKMRAMYGYAPDATLSPYATNSSNYTGSTSQGSTTVAPPTDARTLWATTKDRVIATQEFLNKEINAGLVLDGAYGGKTTAAADKYMKQEGIDGTELVIRVAKFKGLYKTNTALATTSTYTSSQAETDARQLAVWLRNSVLGTPEDKVVTLLSGKSKADYEKIGYFYANKIGLDAGANLNIDIKNKLSVANQQKIFGALKGLGAIYPNDLVVIGEFAPVYDLRNVPQGTAKQGDLLGQVQGSDETAFYFVTREGNVRKVRKSLAALAA